MIVLRKSWEKICWESLTESHFCWEFIFAENSVLQRGQFCWENQFCWELSFVENSLLLRIHYCWEVSLPEDSTLLRIKFCWEFGCPWYLMYCSTLLQKRSEVKTQKKEKKKIAERTIISPINGGGGHLIYSPLYVMFYEESHFYAHCTSLPKYKTKTSTSSTCDKLYKCTCNQISIALSEFNCWRAYTS